MLLIVDHSDPVAPICLTNIVSMCVHITQSEVTSLKSFLSRVKNNE